MRMEVQEDAGGGTWDAQALEEDSYLVLSADPTPRPVREPLRRILAQAAAQAPLPPGTVLPCPGPPLRLLAVVHDLSREPSWTEPWVAEALAAVLREAERHGVRRLALEPLGARHGRLPPERFVALLQAALREASPRGLREIVLLAPPGMAPALREALGPDATSPAGNAPDGGRGRPPPGDTDPARPGR